MADDNPVNGAGPDDKHPGGRPLTFETPAELQRAIDRYFKDCDPHWVYKTDWVQARSKNGELLRDEHGQHYYERLRVRRLTDQQPYTLSGLARALGVDRKTIKNYGKREQFFPTVEAARARCEEYAESQLFGPFARGAAFNLNNNYDGWRDRQELTGKNGEDLGKGWADMLALASKVAEAGGENADGDGRTDTPAS